MKKRDCQKYAPHTPEHVVMHARYQASRGRKPSATLGECRNPMSALELAKMFAYFPEPPEEVKINLKEAKEIAELFLQFGKVKAVEMFGSVARKGKGNDLDLILITDEDTSQIFMRLVEIEIEYSKTNHRGSFYGDALSRNNIAESLLDPDLDCTYEEILEKAKVGIDIFLFPSDWRERLDELQGRMQHDDPKFMEKIAKDARRIA